VGLAASKGGDEEVDANERGNEGGEEAEERNASGATTSLSAPTPPPPLPLPLPRHAQPAEKHATAKSARSNLRKRSGEGVPAPPTWRTLHASRGEYLCSPAMVVEARIRNTEKE